MPVDPTHPHSYGLWVTAALFAVHLLTVSRAITRPNRSPASRVAWVATIMLLPVAGVIAYLLLGETSIGSARIRRMREVEARLPVPRDAGAQVPLTVDSRAQALCDQAASINGLPTTSGNRIALMENSDAAIDSLVADIEQAREQVHISFYIWLDDHNGGKIADAISAAARRGVTCRIMVDALGSRLFTRSPRWRQMRQAGAHLAVALDDVPRLGKVAVGRVDLRNHRKIVVIDDRIAYCGSQNCADPAFLVKARFAPWVDIFLRCEGPTVRQLQYLFLVTWMTETSESVALSAAMPEVSGGVDEGEGVIAQMFGTGPTSRPNAMSDVFVACMMAARERLLITTPYFVPDESMLRALCAAPHRGVDTTIIFPKRNDSWLVGNASRSTYAALLANGVRIHEYPLGLLHTKSMTVDGHVALVGSANMDRRSLELNYENNLLIVDPATTRVIETRQRGYLAVSDPVARAPAGARMFARRLLQNTVAMMGPVL